MRKDERMSDAFPSCRSHLAGKDRGTRSSDLKADDIEVVSCNCCTIFLSSLSTLYRPHYDSRIARYTVVAIFCSFSACVVNLACLKPLLTAV